MIVDATDSILSKRMKKADFMVTPPKARSSRQSGQSITGSTVGIFPLIDPSHFVANSQTDNHARKASLIVKGDRNSLAIDSSTVKK